MLFLDFFDIVSIMDLLDHQRHFLQQLGLEFWVVKSDFLLIQVSGHQHTLILKFSANSQQAVYDMMDRICQSLSLQYQSVERAEIALDCACEPRQIYEKIKEHCFKKGAK